MLPRSFYDRDSLEVAPELLGKVLVRATPAVQARQPSGAAPSDRSLGGPSVVRMGLIVEVEAYRGEEDAASHAFRGRTPRCATMFGEPGRLYVYFTYGMHHCANIVCGPAGTPAAVLLRAIEPLEGVEAMRQARHAHASRVQSLSALASGPGRLCQALGIDRSNDGADLVSGEQGIWVNDDDSTGQERVILCGPRVGLGERVGVVARSQPWRYWIEGNKSVSAPRTGGVPLGRVLSPPSTARSD